MSKVTLGIPDLIRCMAIAVVHILVFLGNVSNADVPKCIFTNVVGFGASVTQATPAMIPGYRALVSSVELYGQSGKSSLPIDEGSPLKKYAPRSYGLSPVRYIVKNYLGSPGLKNIKYVGKYFTQSESDLGSSQVIPFLRGDENSEFNSASLVVGVDAFYWDAIYQNCGFSTGRGVEPIIQALIEKTKSSGKTLVLGTVPFENPVNVRIDSERTGVPGLWYAPDVRCARSINETIHRYCTPENRCYVADLKGAVDDLACGKKLRLRNGEAFGLFEMRPDGVHMSDKGSRYIAELAIGALEENPPSCGPDQVPVSRDVESGVGQR